MTEPYQSPESKLVSEVDKEKVMIRRKFWFRAIWIAVAGIIIPPLFGLAGTVIGMIGAFGELSQTGEADPEALAGDISFSLLTTMWGIVISVIALIVLIGILIRFFTLPKISQAQQGSAHQSTTAP